MASRGRVQRFEDHAEEQESLLLLLSESSLWEPFQGLPKEEAGAWLHRECLILDGVTWTASFGVEIQGDDPEGLSAHFESCETISMLKQTTALGTALEDTGYSRSDPWLIKMTDTF
jgi:hypothetical protein